MRYISLLLMLLALSSCGKDGKNGKDGAQGPAGPTGAYNIVSIVDPCGDSPSVVDEVLLILANGQVLVSFSANANGDNTRFALLPYGSYLTTDGSACYFTLSAAGIVNQHY